MTTLEHAKKRGDKKLVGGLERFLFSHLWGIIIPTDFHIFRGVGQPSRIHQFTASDVFSLIISGQRPTPSIMANALDVVERSRFSWIFDQFLGTLLTKFCMPDEHIIHI